MRNSILPPGMAALAALLLAACGGGGGSSSPSPPPVANTPPTANAGTNQTVNGGVLVTLNGTASSDADGTVASYAWTQTAGAPAITLSSSSASQPTFTAPSLATNTVFTFSLVVTDNRGLASAASTVNVTVNLTPNTPPIANAGNPQATASGSVVTLNGTGSSDPDGTIASYAWTQTVGPAVTLSGNAASQPTFTAPTVATATTLTFSLVVTDNLGAASAASTVNVTVNPLGNVSGRVRFTRILATANGLNYAAPALQPSRGVLVRAVDPVTPTTVLGTTSTDAAGNFSMNVAANTNVRLVVVAQMLRDGSQPLPRWNFSSADVDANPANPAAYTYTDGVTFNSNNGASRNLDIPSGFDATGNVTGTRASAPFAILDTVYQGMQLILGVAPTTNFPALVLDWATDNPGGETFFTTDPSQTIVLSADVTEDTDEYDQHVIAHEFGHYIEFNFSRADNIGGSHGLGDRLDVRVAFGEGFGYAFGAIVLNDPVARDTFASTTQFLNCVPAGGRFTCSSTFNIESNPTTPGTSPDSSGCWCSESSVWSILWDIYDNAADANDTLALGFQPLWNVLINEQRNTHAFTSIFSFISALKVANPARVAAIDTLLAAQNIGSVADAFGTGENNVPAPVANTAALPLYTSTTVGGPAVVLRNVDDAGRYNTLGNHRYVRFTLATARTITISVSSSNTATPDPDFVVFRNGAFVRAGFDAPPQPEVETITNAAAGDYLIDVYDCANGCQAEEGTPGDYDLTVTVN